MYSVLICFIYKIKRGSGQWAVCGNTGLEPMIRTNLDSKAERELYSHLTNRNSG